MLQEDGVSDPPGIKVRALEGLKGCAYLETSNRATKVCRLPATSAAILVTNPLLILPPAAASCL